MTSPPTHNHKTTHGAENMTQDPTVHRKVHEEIAKFEKTMDEMHLIKNVSKDLRNYRRMIRIKQND
jgi:hypothetical protein